jgi:glycosyltransferase involved in cell wall biosynthesis
MSKRPTISLIISTYNWPGALKLCLKSVQRQILLPDEVIVADDGSGEDTRQLINSFVGVMPIPVKHVWHEDEGFRKTLILNKAIKEASGEYIVQIDGDVILNDYFIKDHLFSAEYGTFVRGTRAMLSQKKTQEIFHSQNIRLSPWDSGVLNRNNAIRSSIFKSLGSRKEMSSRSVRGSNLAYWKSDFIQVNGYDNELTGWGHEDEELAARFINNGISKKIVKLCAIQYHLYHPNLSRHNERSQNQAVQKTLTEKILRCTKGYDAS